MSDCLCSTYLHLIRLFIKKNIYGLNLTAFISDFTDVVVQVNPHTHQLKICDFGSAKVLVRFIDSIFNEFILGSMTCSRSP